MDKDTTATETKSPSPEETDKRTAALMEMLRGLPRDMVAKMVTPMLYRLVEHAVAKSHELFVELGIGTMILHGGPTKAIEGKVTEAEAKSTGTVCMLFTGTITPEDFTEVQALFNRLKEKQPGPRRDHSEDIKRNPEQED